jgi:hypothetical protein
MGIGANERVALKGLILEQTSSIFDCAPPLNGKLADLGASLWNARDEPALAIDDGGKPVPGNVLDTKETPEFSMPNGDSKPAKGLAVLEDGNLDTGTPILRDRT